MKWYFRLKISLSALQCYRFCNLIEYACTSIFAFSFRIWEQQQRQDMQCDIMREYRKFKFWFLCFCESLDCIHVCTTYIFKSLGLKYLLTKIELGSTTLKCFILTPYPSLYLLRNYFVILSWETKKWKKKMVRLDFTF